MLLYRLSAHLPLHNMCASMCDVRIGDGETIKNELITPSDATFSTRTIQIQPSFYFEIDACRFFAGFVLVHAGISDVPMVVLVVIDPLSFEHFDITRSFVHSIQNLTENRTRF